MQKPQYILDFTNICHQYKLIIIWTVCCKSGFWATRTFHHRFQAPRIVPTRRLRPEAPAMGLSFSWKCMKIPCSVCCYVFYPTKLFDRMWQNAFVSTVVFMIFMTLMVMATWGCPNKWRWRTLSPEASVSGRDYCAARGRSCVKSTVRIPWEPRAEIQGACADGFPRY